MNDTPDLEMMPLNFNHTSWNNTDTDCDVYNHLRMWVGNVFGHVCLSVCVRVCLSVCLSVCVSVCLCFCLFRL